MSVDVMRARRALRRAALLVLLCGVSLPAFAQNANSNLRVLPNPARPGEAVVARLHREGCSPAPLTPRIEGNRIRLVPPDFVICFSPPPPPSDFDVPLGAFSAPGFYTVTAPSGTGADLVLTFEVAGSLGPGTTVVPVVSHPALLTALALGFVLVAAITTRRR
jgi:hypothetical protein